MAIDVFSVPGILDFNAKLKLQGLKVHPIDTKKGRPDGQIIEPY